MRRTRKPVPRAASRREFLAAAAALPAAGAALAAPQASPPPPVPPLVDTSLRFGRHVVRASIERPPAELVARFRQIAREVVVEHVNRAQIMDPAIRPLASRDWSVIGPAVTVNLEAYDHLMCVAALGVARAGDVIVVAAQGRMHQGVWGSGLTMSARNLGVEAVVVDGAVMDSRAILARDVPVFSRGSHPAHGSRDKPGSVNVPVSCGGVIVNPGDLVFGDLDGVVVVRREDAAAILAACEAKSAQLRSAAAAMGASRQTFFDLIGGRDAIVRAGVEWIE
jgi:4-hydroxy-4-methyl-2-oxoglutarate aldolase